MPVFAIILDDCIAESKIAKGLRRDDIYEKDNINKYIYFESFVKTKIVCFAKNNSEIKLSIHENLNQFEETHKLIGWIKANCILEYSDVQELHNISKENAILKSKISELQDEINNKNKYEVVDIDSEFDIIVPYNYANENRKKSLRITWSKLFSIIAPDIISHQNEAHVHLQLSKYLFKMLELSSSCSSSIIDEQDFFTIRTQMMAYGLVHVQSLSTTNGTMALFWILTEKGSQLMMKLRTVKK